MSRINRRAETAGDSYLVDTATGKAENVTGVEQVSFYNSELFFWPNDPTAPPKPRS